MTSWIAGTRGSALARWQTSHVIAQLGVQVEERVITTQGDTNLAQKLVGSLEKGFFTQELEAELRAGTIHFAVHSLKDLPTRQPPQLCLGAVLPRAGANDLLLVKESALHEQGPGVLPLKAGSKIGSSSVRREALLRRFSTGASPVPLRGNVPTRVQKLKDGLFDGVLLAAAGVGRLGLDLSGIVCLELNPRAWTPAPGQGAIAVQCRTDDTAVRELLGKIHHPATAAATALERDFLRVLEGGCTTPFGCYVEGPTAWLGVLQGDAWRRTHLALQSSAGWIEAALADLASPHFTEKTDGYDWLWRKV